MLPLYQRIARVRQYRLITIPRRYFYISVYEKIPQTHKTIFTVPKSHLIYEYHQSHTVSLKLNEIILIYYSRNIIVSEMLQMSHYYIFNATWTTSFLKSLTNPLNEMCSKNTKTKCIRSYILPVVSDVVFVIPLLTRERFAHILKVFLFLIEINTTKFVFCYRVIGMLTDLYDI